MSFINIISSLMGSNSAPPPDPPPDFTGKEYDVTRAAMTLSGATDTETDHLLLFTKRAVDNDFYRDLIFCFPFVGSKIINLLDPESIDEALRLTGTFSSDADGIYIASGNELSTHLDITDTTGKEWPYLGIGVYLQTEVNSIIETGDLLFKMQLRGTASKTYCNIIGDSNGVTLTSTTLSGWIMAQRTAKYTASPLVNPAVQIWKNGILLGTDLQYNGAEAMPSGVIKLKPSADVVVSFFAMHRTMDSTKTDAYNDAVYELMQNLGRLPS